MTNLRRWILWSVLGLMALMSASCDDDRKDPPAGGSLQLFFLRLGPFELNLHDHGKNTDSPIDKPVIGGFSSSLDRETVPGSVVLLEKDSQTPVPLTFSFLDTDKTFSALPATPLKNNLTYILRVTSGLKGSDGQSFPGFETEFKTAPVTLTVTSLEIGGASVPSGGNVFDVPTDEGLVLKVGFSGRLNTESITESSVKINNALGQSVAVDAHVALDELTITVNESLHDFTRYQLVLTDKINGEEEARFTGYARYFFTGAGADNDFPTIGDEELLTLVQQQTFNYFYDFAHPASGMARERNTSGDLVTSGGSGFGIMALIVGIERNFITRDEGVERFERIIGFLETADRFHGAWSHWINGNTGNVIAFSTNDNGGDLVETSLLVQGLLTLRQYLNPAIAEEDKLIDRINALWHTVEWDWYTRDGQNVLYWHWSPDKGWAMNLPIRGYNEALITYVLAAASPTHSIDAGVYHEGWAMNGGILNGKTFYGVELPLGFDYGGPLFFAHYSFLGLDPRNLSDQYATYWQQNTNHTLINYHYSVDNPKGFVGYSEDSWGLTASDNHAGYSAHSPTNDRGVITPTAALSSMPYTPEESMRALRFFYYKLGDRLWGPYGFYDAFNLTEGWVANSYLAIDQGPIVVMIENYRTGLLWELFMSAPEVQDGLDKLGFTY